MAVAILTLLCAPATLAQPGADIVWEQMPLFTNSVPSQRVYAIDWLRGNETGDPALDTLIMFHGYGVYRYAPGEANGEWGAWRLLNNNRPQNGLVTSEGTIAIVSRFYRSTDSGLTWQGPGDAIPPLVEVTLPWMREVSNGRSVLLAGYGVYDHTISYSDGEIGSWRVTGPASFFPESLGEVPPSAALPLGRLLHNGEKVMYSDDGSETWQMAALGGQPEQSYRRFEFAFLPKEGHPYGGIVFATGCEYFQCDSAGFGTGETADLWRSDDGGASWAFVHHFTAAETGVPVIDYIGPQAGVPFIGPEGALWVGISRTNGGLPNPGRILRSFDEGLTWHHVDSGLGQANQGRGWRIYQLKLARDGRMYAATDQGVWRTTQPVATAAQANPPRPEAPEITVSPNPSSGSVTLSVTASESARYALVDVFSLEGRSVEIVHANALAVGQHTFAVDVSGWAAGTYVARVWTEGVQQSTRFTVAR